jgi:hypothetical protein
MFFTFFGSVAIIRQPVSPIIRQPDSPTDMCLIFTFAVQVRTVTKYKYAGIHKKDPKL